MNLVASQETTTVVAEFEPQTRKADKIYGSEAELEKEFIQQLVSQGYQYLDAKNQTDLLVNLRNQIQRLNNYVFTENEWTTFKKQYLLKENYDSEDCSDIVHNNYIYNLIQEKSGETKNIKIFDKENIHNNSLQVINQYTAVNSETEKQNRYDVTILVNGIPMVHIELKRHGISLKEAFNQIKRYSRETFENLFLYPQIYVISNGDRTKYYANSVRKIAVNSNNNLPNYKQMSNSFEFTSKWADAKNHSIDNLFDFCETFFAKHTILNILFKYSVLTYDKKLMVLRPYQIVATERIINKIKSSILNKNLSNVNSGGYIWHTTGSGKTLTSFRTATLAKEIPSVDKVLFVVDRKDLDYQTIQEYERYSRGIVSSNVNTNQLTKQMSSSDDKIIVTTIQRLSIFTNKNPKHEIYNKNVVIIFDECHRSQFGKLHQNIIKKFKNYILFGFTGTPIWDENSIKSIEKDGTKAQLTTELLFGQCLHEYTIEAAIKDKNVLPWKVHYVQTVSVKEDKGEEYTKEINKTEVKIHEKRIREIVKFILENYDQLTIRNKNRSFDFDKIANISSVVKNNNKYKNVVKKEKSNLNGFNSILACSSVEAAKKYYLEFKNQQANLPENKRLKIGLIYSYSPNEEEITEDKLDLELGEENNENTDNLDQPSRDFLEAAITDYNQMFNTSYSTSSQNFNNYYKDFSLRLKNRELDLAIVVNMFLTGFDAPTLNTLWIDRRLKHHGLIQAMSRTNRILNTVKSHGNIVCFQKLEDEINEALRMFSSKNEHESRVILLRTFEDYYNGYTDENNNFVLGFKDLFDKLLKNFEPNFIEKEGFVNSRIKEFVKDYNKILRLINLLSQFVEVKENTEILQKFERAKDIIRERRYDQTYQDIKDDYDKKRRDETASVVENVYFETDLIKSYDIDINYILNLVSEKIVEKNDNTHIYYDIENYILDSPNLRKKKELIEQFLKKELIPNKPEEDIYQQWNAFAEKKTEESFQAIVKSFNLYENKARIFFDSLYENSKRGEANIFLLKGREKDMNDLFIEKLRLLDIDSAKKRNERKNKLEEAIIQHFEMYTE